MWHDARFCCNTGTMCHVCEMCIACGPCKILATLGQLWGYRRLQCGWHTHIYTAHWFASVTSASVCNLGIRQYVASHRHAVLPDCCPRGPRPRTSVLHFTVCSLCLVRMVESHNLAPACRPCSQSGREQPSAVWRDPSRPSVLRHAWHQSRY